VDDRDILVDPDDADIRRVGLPALIGATRDGERELRRIALVDRVGKRALPRACATLGPSRAACWQ
jgi:hypothetical protein